MRGVHHHPSCFLPFCVNGFISPAHTTFFQYFCLNNLGFCTSMEPLHPMCSHKVVCGKKHLATDFYESMVTGFLLSPSLPLGYSEQIAVSQSSLRFKLWQFPYRINTKKSYVKMSTNIYMMIILSKMGGLYIFFEEIPRYCPWYYPELSTFLPCSWPWPTLCRILCGPVTQIIFQLQAGKNIRCNRPRIPVPVTHAPPQCKRELFTSSGLDQKRTSSIL